MAYMEYNEEDKHLVDLLMLCCVSDPAFIYGSESMAQKVLHKCIDFRRSEWVKQSTCYFPGCTNKAVKDCHSISNKMMIHPIADDQHVISPLLDHHSRSYMLKRVGVNMASVFPGFCSKHEASFAFEKEGVISDSRGLQMHMFRTICHNLHFIEVERRHTEYNRELVGKYMMAALAQYLKINPPAKTDQRKILDGILRMALEGFDLRIQRRMENISFVKCKWYEPNGRLFGYGTNDEFYKLFYDELVECPAQPVTLSCASFFDETPRDENGTPDFSYTYYVNMFPNRGATHVHFTCLSEKSELLKKLASRFEGGRFAALQIERWMINETENWFMRPSFFESKGEQFRNHLITLLNRSIGL
ncbi:MAG: hypothetical protein HQL42_08940 [Alphaproteobacteria bacterium]|nr:hypothetical protein [Alphaproteobacteria bacterium]